MRPDQQSSDVGRFASIVGRFECARGKISLTSDLAIGQNIAAIESKETVEIES
ncbi:hypothetical protein RBSH_04957 [Rhodopirellula baltica SH28]|uniref:Uncharacterized protein n=2 Tax=Rhodopirellula baltica TaxID=265606 RepID=F2AWI8_RHOBT|nr:hypothetical protein RBWH47_00726 [Rhodopirellula baltica WH47]EKJ99873.1 hypothetical protein RBSH_04957 [Rhodopirellula baltica SH28]